MAVVVVVVVVFLLSFLYYYTSHQILNVRWCLDRPTYYVFIIDEETTRYSAEIITVHDVLSANFLHVIPILLDI